MKVYGLTGGIGAGKSEASRRFEHHGIPVLDADSIAHGVMEPGGAAFGPVVERFGEDILSGGRIDRVKLGAKVFGDPIALGHLNEIVHPAVGVEIASRLAAHMEEGHGAALIEAALHGDDGELRHGMSGLVLVTAPLEARIQRLVESRDLSREEALKRIEAQVPPEKKIDLARWVVQNDRGLEHLHLQIDDIVKELKS